MNTPLSSSATTNAANNIESSRSIKKSNDETSSSLSIPDDVGVRCGGGCGTNAETAGRPIEKENRRPPSSSDNNATTTHAESEFRRGGEQPSKATRGRNNNLARNAGISGNGSPSEDSSGNEESLEGVRLCYFDENNVMDGAAAGEGRCGGEDAVDFLTSRRESDDGDDQYDNRCSNGTVGGYNDDDTSYDDDYSEASGDTVVHNDCPPPPENATREEMNRFYWEWCYGPPPEEEDSDIGRRSKNVVVFDDIAMRSAVKSAPSRSCLSTRKKCSANKPPLDSMTPRRILHHSPTNNNNDDADNSRPSTPTEDTMEDTTPTNNITRLRAPSRPRTQSAVKFGTNSAAEFDLSKPITELTPIPPSVVQTIFPTDVKETEGTIEEEGASRETAKNVATLAEWDDDFDDIIDDGDGDGDNGGRRKHGKKRATPYKRSGRGRRSVSSVASRPRKSRRESSLFSRERRSLIEMEDDNRDGSTDGNGGGRGGDSGGNLLPFSVTIDPGEYASPSSASVSDSISTLGTPGALSSACDRNDHDVGMPNATTMLDCTEDNRAPRQTRDERRDSLDSAFISPSSSFKSSECVESTIEMTDGNNNLQEVGDDVGSGSNGSGRESDARNSMSTTTTTTTTTTVCKDTPNSARTSSSTILRAVHASGALLPGNHSPPQGGGGGCCPGGGGAAGIIASSSSGNGSGDILGENGRAGVLRPNQLKYSPSCGSSSSSNEGSSGGSSSGSSTVRMDISPSSSESIGSDIMNLFAYHSLDDSTRDDDSDDDVLSKLLSVFSAHPTQPFDTSIGDMIKWIESSCWQDEDKDLPAFVNEHLLRGMSLSTSLLFVANTKTNGKDENSMLYGNSNSLQFALYDDKKNIESGSFVQTSFGSILLEEMNEMMNSSPHSRPSRKRSTTMTDADMHTVSSCIQLFHNISCMDWSSLELDCSMRALRKLQEWARSMQEKMDERNTFVMSCCKKLMEATAKTMLQLDKSGANAAKISATSNAKKTTLRKRKVQSQIQVELSQIKSLEDQLELDVSRLDETKRAKRMFDAHLDMERCSGYLSALTEEIRTSIVPAPIMSLNASDVTFKLLDGSAEIVMKINLIDDDDDDDDATATSIDLSAVSLGCFIKDDGPSIRFLQAILLGNIDTKLARTLGPLPLRKNIALMVLENESREDLTQQMTHLFSRIDMLVRSVKDLEMNGFCTVNPCGDGDVSLLVSMPHEGVVVQIGFLFRKLLGNDWRVRTFPDDVNVSIVSTKKKDLSLHQRQLQAKAQSILGELKSSSANPILLRRVCVELMDCFTTQEAGS